VFTGLIETVGTARRSPRRGAGARLVVEAEWPDGDSPARGDSVAVNGACLTVTTCDAGGFEVDVSPETLSRTLLGELGDGEAVNLERALRLGARLGGHIVQGHVDAVVRLLAIRPEGGFSSLRLSLPTDRRREVVLKGSVALDGVSLTVASLADDSFEVALVPETLASTTLHRRRVGSRLHLETDVLAKYVARVVGDRQPSALEQLFGPGVEHA